MILINDSELMMMMMMFHYHKLNLAVNIFFQPEISMFFPFKYNFTDLYSHALK